MSIDLAVGMDDVEERWRARSPHAIVLADDEVIRAALVVCDETNVAGEAPVFVNRDLVEYFGVPVRKVERRAVACGVNTVDAEGQADGKGCLQSDVLGHLACDAAGEGLQDGVVGRNGGAGVAVCWRGRVR